MFPDNWYMTLSKDMHSPDRAAVETPTIHSSSTTLRCFTFYFFMNGANVGDLSLIPRLASTFSRVKLCHMLKAVDFWFCFDNWAALFICIW